MRSFDHSSYVLQSIVLIAGPCLGWTWDLIYGMHAGHYQSPLVGSMSFGLTRNIHQSSYRVDVWRPDERLIGFVEGRDTLSKDIGCKIQNRSDL